MNIPKTAKEMRVVTDTERARWPKLYKEGAVETIQREASMGYCSASVSEGPENKGLVEKYLKSLGYKVTASTLENKKTLLVEW